MYYRINTGGITEESIRSYYVIKKRMGKIIRAKMTGGKRNRQYELTLFDAGGNMLTIVSGIAAGTNGMGSRETLEILKDAGFQVSGCFVTKHSSFDIGRDGEGYEV